MGGVSQCAEARLQLIRRFAAAAVLAEQMEARLANGHSINITDHALLSSTLVRLAQCIGIDRRLRNSICTSIVVAAELRYGCQKSGSPRLLKAVEDLLGEIDVLPFDVPADAEYGAIRSELETGGRPIGGNDMLIAAHAPATRATIVTGNIDEFARVRGLKVENWLA
jgi:tRNA(fMet)-specific endonuclease VapC